MKRFTALALSLLLLIAVLPVSAVSAREAKQTAPEIIYFEDGSYLEIVITESSARTTNVKSGQKSYTYKNASGSAQWTATLTARFTYDGTTSECTNVATSYGITNADWYLISKSASKSGNTATGKFTFGYSSLGTTKTVPVTLTLRCDRNGNLS